jgi:hypothetical protein
MNALQMYLEAKNREELQMEIMLLSQISGEVQQYFDWQMQTSNPESFEMVPYEEEILKIFYDRTTDLERTYELSKIIALFHGDKTILNLYLYISFFVLKEMNTFTRNRRDFTPRLLNYGLSIFSSVLNSINRNIHDEESYLLLKEELRKIMEDAQNFNCLNYHEELHQIFNHY